MQRGSLTAPPFAFGNPLPPRSYRADMRIATSVGSGAYEYNGQSRRDNCGREDIDVAGRCRLPASQKRQERAENYGEKREPQRVVKSHVSNPLNPLKIRRPRPLEDFYSIGGRNSKGWAKMNGLAFE